MTPIAHTTPFCREPAPADPLRPKPSSWVTSWARSCCPRGLSMALQVCRCIDTGATKGGLLALGLLGLEGAGTDGRAREYNLRVKMRCTEYTRISHRHVAIISFIPHQQKSPSTLFKHVPSIQYTLSSLQLPGVCCFRPRCELHIPAPIQVTS